MQLARRLTRPSWFHQQIKSWFLRTFPAGCSANQRLASKIQIADVMKIWEDVACCNMFADVFMYHGHIGTPRQYWPIGERFLHNLVMCLALTRLEAIATRLEAIALRLDAIATRLEAIALRLEAIASRLEAIPTRANPARSDLRARIRLTGWSEPQYLPSGFACFVCPCVSYGAFWGGTCQTACGPKVFWLIGLLFCMVLGAVMHR